MIQAPFGKDLQTEGLVKIPLEISEENVAVLFGVLTTGLYGNPILATVRETVNNAYDANVEAGRPTQPIQVILPSTLSPEFIVKDNGIGINPARLIDTFLKFGNSTKRDSNSYIGQFGIGSKAPLAYTNSFSIITVAEGWKYFYAMCTDDLGHPQLMEWVDSRIEVGDSEPSGTEIRVPVKKGDAAAFKEEACKLFQYWTIKPVIVGIPEDFDETKTLFEGNNWYLTHSKASQKPAMVCCTGNTPYPIDFNQAPSLPIGSFPIELGGHYTLVIRAPIGTVAVVASREGLNYTPTTLNYIAGEFDRISKTVLMECVAQLKLAKDISDFFRRYDAIKAMVPAGKFLTVGQLWNKQTYGEIAKLQGMSSVGWTMSKYIFDGRRIQETTVANYHTVFAGISVLINDGTFIKHDIAQMMNGEQLSELYVINLPAATDVPEFVTSYKKYTKLKGVKLLSSLTQKELAPISVTGGNALGVEDKFLLTIGTDVSTLKATKVSKPEVGGIYLVSTRHQDVAKFADDAEIRFIATMNKMISDHKLPCQPINKLYIITQTQEVTLSQDLISYKEAIKPSVDALQDLVEKRWYCFLEEFKLIVYLGYRLLGNIVIKDRQGKDSTGQTVLTILSDQVYKTLLPIVNMSSEDDELPQLEISSDTDSVLTKMGYTYKEWATAGSLKDLAVLQPFIDKFPLLPPTAATFINDFNQSGPTPREIILYNIEDYVTMVLKLHKPKVIPTKP